MPRIDPVTPPYDVEVGERLEEMMPPGVPPIVLFRIFVRNLPMTTAMRDWGGYELSRRLSLTMRDPRDRDRPHVRAMRLRVRVGGPRGVLRPTGRAEQ